MAFPTGSEADLLIALQAIAAGEPAWDTLLARIQALTGAGLAAMVVRRPAQDQVEIALAAAQPHTAARIDRAALEAILTDRMRPERLYSAEDIADLLGDGAGAISAALAGLGFATCIAVKLSAADAPAAIIGIFGTGPFRAADGGLLRQLLPYLQPAVRSAERIGRERRRAALTADLAVRAARAWFLIDDAEWVIDWWTDGTPLPVGLDLITAARGHRLVLDDRRAADALAAILAAPALHRERALAIAPGRSWHLRITPDAAQAAVAHRAPKRVTLHERLQLVPDCAAMLVDLFDLLPSEARLAAALAGGDGLAQAAERLGLTLETARNYSKRIFAKTDTHGQADLVRLILSHGLTT